jgi:hypothetical protein
LEAENRRPVLDQIFAVQPRRIAKAKIVALLEGEAVGLALVVGLGTRDSAAAVGKGIVEAAIVQRLS